MEENPKTADEVLELILDENEERDKNVTLDLTNLNIPDLKISEAEINNVNFSHSTLPNFTLNAVVMDNVNLSETTLTNSTISDCIFDVDVNLRGVNLTEAHIKNTDISKADFRNTNSKQTKLIDTTITGGSIIYSTFENVTMTEVIIDNVTMTRVNLKGVDLTSASIKNSKKLKEIDFTNATLINTDFTDSVFEQSVFENATMTNVILTRVVMKDINLSDLDLSGVKMMGANLSGVDFSGSDLSGADLTGAIVKGTIFHNTNITDTIFKDVKLYKAKILSGVDLKTANLTDADLSGVVLTDDDMYRIVKKGKPKKFITIERHPDITRTRKMIRYNKSRKNQSEEKKQLEEETYSEVETPPEEEPYSFKEKCINILIMSHGYTDQTKRVDAKLFNNVEISLMGGGIGIYGLMGITKNRPIRMRDIHDENKIYKLKGYRTYNETVLDLIYNVFPNLLEKYDIGSLDETCNEEFFNIFSDLVTYVKTFFDSIGHKYFPKQDEFVPDGVTQQRRNSFIKYNSLNEKMFQFFPNPYEYCVRPELREKCVLMDSDFRQLSYGLHILQSSDPDDLPYSLAGISMSYGEYSSSNLNYWRSTRVKDYWRKKLVKNTQHLIPRISSKLMNIYNRLSVGLDPNGLYNESSEGKLVSLTEIITLFKVGFGFTSVNIIDFSCNECKYGLPSHVSRAITDTIGSNSYLKQRRQTKNNSTKEEWEKITNPPLQDIIDVVGKAKSEEKQKVRTKTKRLTFGGGKTKKRRRKFRKM
jgi:uncharacterized protein YjbI with pentapeptide repeats